MAATAARNTPRELTPHDQCRDYAIAANVKIWAGTLVMLTAAGGLATPGAAAVGAIAAGRANKTYDNTGGSASAFRIEVEEGCFLWANSGGGDVIATANIGDVCFIVDNETVALTDDSGARSVAGVVRKVESGGVWVQTGLGISGTAPAEEA